MSEYDPIFIHDGSDDGAADGGASAGRDPLDLERVQGVFSGASRAYLATPVNWLAWSILLPGAALAHRALADRVDPPMLMLLWGGAFLAGGVVDSLAVFLARGGRRRLRPTPLVAWVFRMQINLSLMALLFSVGLYLAGAGWLIPALWLLLVGHSFYLLGGLSFRPFKIYGLLHQVGGVVALWPDAEPLVIFAGATGVANLWLAIRVWRRSG